MMTRLQRASQAGWNRCHAVMGTLAPSGETVAPEVWSRVDIGHRMVDVEEGPLWFLTRKSTLGSAQSVTLCSWCRFSSWLGRGPQRNV